MQTCPECFSTDIDALEIGDSPAETILECGGCGAQCTEAEINGE